MINLKNMEIKEFVQNFAEQFDDTDVEVFTPELAFRELEEWSSFLALAIMAMIKSEYDVAISADEMRNANTIQELFDTVQKHLS
jgi:acyl carrier protein